MTVNQKANDWLDRRMISHTNEHASVRIIEAYKAGYNEAQSENDIPPTTLSEAVGDEATQAYGIDFQQERPDHYRKFGFEVWEMMREQFGDVLFYAHLQMAALEYQMRVGHKEGQTESDLRKIKTLFEKMAEIENERPNIRDEVKKLTR
jgi:hypothetical protein